MKPTKRTYNWEKLNPVIEELLQKFLDTSSVNIDDEIILLHQLQKAYWCYIDNIMHQENLPEFTEEEFFIRCFQQSKQFKLQKDYVVTIYNAFKQYLDGIPVAGCVLVNKKCTKVVMIKSKVYEKVYFDFPKGKAERNESTINCAIRETWEEIGVIVDNKITDRHKIEFIYKGKQMTLYFIFGLDDDEDFKILNNKEVEQVLWVHVNDLSKIVSRSYYHIIDNIKDYIFDYSNKNNIRLLTKNSPQKSPKIEKFNYNRFKKELSTINRSPKGKKQKGWSPKEMFETNEKLFGIKSTYNLDDYISV